MQYAQIALRPADQEDMSFLLDLRRETMDAHLVGSGLSFSVEEHIGRVLYRFDCAQIIESAGEAVGF